MINFERSFNPMDPDFIVDSSNVGSLVTPSGNTIEVEVSDIEVSFEDRKMSCHVSAKVTQSGFIEVLVRTKMFRAHFTKNARHPDLYAAKLLHKQFEYLRRKNPDIKGFRAEWTTNPVYKDNTITFISNLENINLSLADVEDIHPEDPRWEIVCTAAFDTWSGRFAQSEGFSSIKAISIWKLGHPTDQLIRIEFVPPLSFERSETE